jgi:molybdopterin-guanine dinucleotide biosynthesis protein B
VALVNAVIFQIVGFQNSGKTTIIEKLIRELNSHNCKVVTIKHHGHGGKPEVPTEKDSEKHLEAGAAASIVEGGGRLIFQAENFLYSIDDQIKLANYLEPDIILIEGHKDKDFPKLLLIRNQEDLTLIQRVKNIRAIMIWDKHLYVPNQYPSFLIDDDTAIPWIAENLIQKKEPAE